MNTLLETANALGYSDDYNGRKNQNPYPFWSSEWKEYKKEYEQGCQDC